MRVARWRYGILALAVFLALPVMAQEGGSMCGEESYSPATATCLRWYSLVNGTAQYKAFSFPPEGSCSAENLKCFLGETKLDNCETLTPDEVSFDTETQKFYVEEYPAAEVYCFREEAYINRLFVDDGKKEYCKVANTSLIEKQWNPPFLPYEEGEKANPWDGNASYCPDPIMHSSAYDMDEWNNSMPTQEIMRRRVLDACITVVTKYQDACDKKLGNISGEKSGEVADKETAIEDIKHELIAEWIGESSCDATSWKENCSDSWNLVKNYTANDLATRDGAFLNDPQITNVTLKNALLAQKIENEEETDGQKKWTSGTSLDAFLTAQADSEWSSSTEGTGYSATIATKNEDIKKVNAVLNFLQKKKLNLELSNALSQTKTFNVTNLLRRRSGEDGTTESELTMFQQDDNGTSRNIFDKVIRLVAQVLGSLGVLLLIISAVIMIVSQGEEQMLQKAKQTFLYTLIGLAIAFFSYTIVRFILELLLTR